MGIVGCGWGGDVDSAQLHLIAVFTVPRARIFVHSLVFERTRIPRSVATAPEPPLDYQVLVILIYLVLAPRLALSQYY